MTNVVSISAIRDEKSASVKSKTSCSPANVHPTMANKTINTLVFILQIYALKQQIKWLPKNYELFAMKSDGQKTMLVSERRGYMRKTGCRLSCYCGLSRLVQNQRQHLIPNFWFVHRKCLRLLWGVCQFWFSCYISHNESNRGLINLSEVVKNRGLT